MIRWQSAILIIIIFIIVLVLYNAATKLPTQSIINNMKIESPVFKNNEKIPAKYTCDRENINPPLLISGMPENTKSLALVVDDPDAPVGTWVHWIVVNIDPATREIPENSVPVGSLELKTSFGKPGYGGPCPPSGTHRYFFKLYALDAKINSVEEIGKYTIAKTELIGLYNRVR